MLINNNKKYNYKINFNKISNYIFLNTPSLISLSARRPSASLFMTRFVASRCVVCCRLVAYCAASSA